MKKKLAMRIASLALCVVFTGMLFAAPKSKAVVAETAAVAIGTAVLATCLVSFGLSIQTDSGDTVGEGISSMVGDYIEYMAFDTTPDGWLTDVANATTMTSPGVLLYQGAWAKNMSNFIEWLLDHWGLDDDGKEAEILPGKFSLYSYGSIQAPPVPEFSSDGLCTFDWYFMWIESSTTKLVASSSATAPFVSGSYLYFNDKIYTYSLDNGAWSNEVSYSPSYTLDARWFNNNSSAPRWANFDIYSGSYIWLAGSALVGVGDSAGQLDISRNPGFANIAEGILDDQALTFHTGLLSETLEEFASDAPWAIVEGTYAPSVELTQTGEGTEEVNPPDDTTVVPGVTPWLQSIFNAIKAVGTSIVNGVKGLFIPTDTAIDSLSAEVDNKLPFIPTLQGFGDDLVYNLEHPEECADGLGLTTVVDLSKGRGTYLGNTRHELLDVSWYLEYKPLVDDIIVGFCWLVFLWNCYGALPRIIHGEGSIVGAINLIKEEDGP